MKAPDVEDIESQDGGVEMDLVDQLQGLALTESDLQDAPHTKDSGDERKTPDVKSLSEMFMIDSASSKVCNGEVTVK